MAPRHTVFIVSQGFRSARNFFDTEVLPTLAAADVQLVVLVPDVLSGQIEQQLQPFGVITESFQRDQCIDYRRSYRPVGQHILDYLRRSGWSNRCNLGATRNFQRLEKSRASPKWGALLSLVEPLVELMRRSRFLRQLLVRQQTRWFTSNIYGDLFEKYRPHLVVSDTPGWFYDQYLLREAKRFGATTAAVVFGWDNPSTYGLLGAPVDFISCWSAVQKDELVQGSDCDPSRVHVAGIPLYDGYIQKKWVIPRKEYFLRRGLDLDRKLLAYACTFVSYSPNIQNIESLVKLVASDDLVEPCQLLIRLHPSHQQRKSGHREEREAIYDLAKTHKHVHVVEPLVDDEAIAYSHEDLDDIASMLSHCAVFFSIFSTMVVEAALHDKPTIAMCIDSTRGWPGRYWLRLSEITGWPTHSRFVNSGAGVVIYQPQELKEAVNAYLANGALHSEQRREFAVRECTYVDGSAGRRTGDYLLSLLDGT